MSVFVIVSAGVLSMLSQIVFIRRFLSVFSGNELDIGITLSIWFVTVGAGSLLGSRIHRRDLLAWSFVALGLLLQPSLGALSFVRPLSARAFGEVLPLSVTVGGTLAILFPVCLVIGAQFPLALQHFGGSASRLYGLEGFGAFIGGLLFTFALSGRVDSLTLVSFLASFSMLVAVVLFRLPIVAWPVILVPLALLRVPAWIGEVGPEGVRVVATAESRYGEIKAFMMGGQYNVYFSGKYLFSYPDPQSEELRSHLPMTLLPQVDRVLVLGGSPAVLRELLKYPAARIDFVESAPELIGLSWGLLGDSDRRILTDSRLTVISSDAGAFIKRQGPETYDLVIYNLPDPSTANINRFYTEERFREIKRLLRKGGVVVLSLQKASGYMGRRVRMLNGSVYVAMAKVFAFPGVSSEEYGILYGSDSPVDSAPGTLEERFLSRHVVTDSFRPYVLRDAFDPLKVAMVQGRVAKVDSSNTDRRPVAYFYSLFVWAEIQGSDLLTAVLGHGRALIVLVGVLFVLGSMLVWRKARVAYFSLSTIGFSSMAFEMVIILSYQAQFGYVYEMIGVISALFMAGIAVGAISFRGISAETGRFRVIELIAMLMMAVFIVALRTELAYYAFSALNGLFCGAGFSWATQYLRKCEVRGAPGKLYAADLGGSFLGAIVTSIFSVPLIGIPNSVLFLVLVRAISLIALFSVPRETA